jgi:hypothetical protein
MYSFLSAHKIWINPPSRIQPRFGCQIDLEVEPEVGGRPTNIINVSFLGVCSFQRPQSSIVCMCAFSVLLDGACASAPCVVIAHLDFITSCIVLDLLEMLFW